MISTDLDVKALVKEFYSKPFYLSYSGLNKLLYSPSLFYRHYVLQQQEDKLESYLVDGKVIHCLILDDGSFDKDFILLPDTLPTGNTRTVLDKLASEIEGEVLPLGSYEEKILEILKEINLHQSLKEDKKRIEKIINEQTKSYWEFLKEKGDKTLVDSETMTRCNEYVDSIRANSEVSNLLGLLTDEMDNVEIHNEKFYKVDTDKSLNLKGVVDNIKIDHDNKTIFVNDLKTTGKTITTFSESIEIYNYWAQGAIYYRLVSFEFADLLEKGYQILFHFVVIDKYQQVYPFEVSEKTMLDWQLRLEKALMEACWHYDERNYTLPYEFVAGKVIL